jgi:hypothetical protein
MAWHVMCVPKDSIDSVGKQGGLARMGRRLGGAVTGTCDKREQGHPCFENGDMRE